MAMLTNDWGYPVTPGELNPNDPIVNTASEYMYQMATVAYHTLHGTQTVILDEDFTAPDGTVYTAGIPYEVPVDGRYWAALRSHQPDRGRGPGAGMDRLAHALIAELGVGTGTASSLQMGLGSPASSQESASPSSSRASAWCGRSARRPRRPRPAAGRHPGLTPMEPPAPPTGHTRRARPKGRAFRLSSGDPADTLGPPRRPQPAGASDRRRDQGRGWERTAMPRRMIALAAVAGLLASFAVAGTTSAAEPDLGPNVLVFDPSMPTSEIQAAVDAIATQQVPNQFGTAALRAAVQARHLRIQHRAAQLPGRLLHQRRRPRPVPGRRRHQRLGLRPQPVRRRLLHRAQQLLALAVEPHDQRDHPGLRLLQRRVLGRVAGGADAPGPRQRRRPR